MAQWILMAVLTALAVIAVVTPLVRRRAYRDAGTAAVMVYRDQLDELERDQARGLIEASEIEAARLEISRRLLRASDSSDSETAVKPVSAHRLAASLGIVGIPAVALVFYLYVGTPNLVDQPLAARLAAPPAESDFAVLIARVEQHLAANPDDGRGWEVLAPAYLRLGRGEDAIAAWENAIRLSGATAEREANLGETIVRVNGGEVTEAARAAFQRATALDNTALRPRYYLALAMSQSGDAGAADAWRQLLAEAPESAAPWAVQARSEIARLEGGTVATAPGPDATAVEAAATMSPEERQAMIDGMVASLADRLADDPRDPEGWARLVRSYLVLGRTEEAKSAAAEARAALAAEPELAARFEALAPTVEQ